MSAPRLRFAPSPTGYLHVGGARTALFNWLFARRHGGAFVLRIEDTDVERSSWEMVEGILQGLRWLGLDWDEGPAVGGSHGPYFQSERRDRYRALANRLASDGRAYYCYCSPELLQSKRDQAERQGLTWSYDRTCARLDPAQVAELEATAASRAIRFRVPEGVIRFVDLVHGPIEFDNANIEDFVVLRSDEHPTYHLSVVADDIDMAITHVVRGDDHISNTPKQVLLYHAFDAPLPQFAHVPLILGPDKRRLSKRHGATSVMEYERLGYLPEAMVNFLALLGWSPGSDQELFGRDELIAAFSLEGISGGNAVFNPEKLEWFNQQYIARLSGDDILARIEPLLRTAGLWSDAYEGEHRPWMLKLIELVRPRAHRLGDFVEIARPLLGEALDFDPAAVQKHLSSRELIPHLETLREEWSRLESFDEPSLEKALRDLAEARGLKPGTLIHAVRVAVTGRAVSPGLFEVLALLGRARTLARLDEARRRIS
ncbi:MAG: glutamate--tRNA ligase [Acidobacteria bacterium]|nr:MAG: glutamate--tRNA ligase [Acidobacteriota bacterium]